MRKVLQAFMILPVGAAMAMSVPTSLADLVRESDLVIIGEVTALGVVRSADLSAIHTNITVRVGGVLRGALDSGRAEVTIRIEGGEIDGVEMRTSVDPAPRVGDVGIFLLQGENVADPFTLNGNALGFLPINGGMVNFEGSLRPVPDAVAEISGY
jgi:hypothetical protein